LKTRSAWRPPCRPDDCKPSGVTRHQSPSRNGGGIQERFCSTMRVATLRIVALAALQPRPPWSCGTSPARSGGPVMALTRACARRRSPWIDRSPAPSMSELRAPSMSPRSPGRVRSIAVSGSLSGPAWTWAAVTSIPE
jgi:hypothetical protein